MKFLADANIESKVVQFLRNSGYDVKWVLEDNPFLSDEDILEISYKEKRILITNDKDFGELVYKDYRNTFSIILLRVEQNDVMVKIKIVENPITKHKDKIENKFIVANKNKIRFINI
jgi:predicted nuclease of predicted toxin-antitoxin system